MATHEFKELLEVSGTTEMTLRKVLKERGIRSLHKGCWGEDAYLLSREIGSAVPTRELLKMSPWESMKHLINYLRRHGLAPVIQGRWPPEAKDLIPEKKFRSAAKCKASWVSVEDGVEETPVPKPQEKPQKKKGRLWRVCVLDDCGWWMVALAGLDLDRAKDNVAEIMSRGKAVMVRPC